MSAAAQKAFAAAVGKSAKASGKSSASAMGSALGALVNARLRKRSASHVRKQQAADRLGFKLAPDGTPLPKPQRRAPIRRGRTKAYSPTTKVDISRLGTFRHYMLQTIRAHSNTRDAEIAHASCDDPKFAGKKLDFGWAAAEGYITFE